MMNIAVKLLNLIPVDTTHTTKYLFSNKGRNNFVPYGVPKPTLSHLNTVTSLHVSSQRSHKITKRTVAEHIYISIVERRNLNIVIKYCEHLSLKYPFLHV
jgi:hypothetical protein